MELGRWSAANSPYEPDCEWVISTIGPSLSINGTRASRLSAWVTSGFCTNGTCEAKNWSNVASPATPVPGHWVCRRACGHSEYFSEAVKRCCTDESCGKACGPSVSGW